MKRLMILCAALLGAGCSDTDDARHANPGSGGSSGGTGTGGATSTGGSSGSGGSGTGGSAETGGNSTAGTAGSDSDAAATEDAGSETMIDGAATSDGGFVPPAGMKQIFDGVSLSGWDGNPAIWSVEAADSAIRGKTNNGGQLINTKDTYESFRMVVTARMLVETKNHTGICFWGAPATPGKWGYNGCLDLMPPWGGLWDYQANKSLLAPEADQSIQSQWMLIELLALPTGQVLAAINGKQTTDKAIAGRARPSPIGLQAHAGASDQEFKDIWVEIDPPVHTLLTLKP
jgi:Domain of Unknown Function (DUF1080)